VIGGSEAPITPEVVDGFYAMSALSDDKRMLELQALQNESIENGPNQIKACRPFGNNIGMVLGESAQFTILMDDALALELGANIYGSVPSVFSHADGYKSSISGPGIGNYITMAKCVSSASKILGTTSLKSRTFVHAHGTGTPANRTTESHILNEVAKTHGIKSWPISAIKSYLGHSMAPASGDQLITSLGTWEKGVIPGIHSIDQIADDVHDSNLDILMEHKIEDPNYFEAAFLNAKGFGGNNASALILSPDKTKTILEKKFSHSKMKSYHAKLVGTKKETEKHNRSCLKGRYNVTYKFNENVLQGESDVEIKKDSIRLKGFSQPIKLK
jgi:acetoacetyl-[acyl-carrier protein] synthase